MLQILFKILKALTASNGGTAPSLFDSRTPRLSDKGSRMLGSSMLDISGNIDGKINYKRFGD